MKARMKPIRIQVRDIKIRKAYAPKMKVIPDKTKYNRKHNQATYRDMGGYFVIHDLF